MKIVTTSTGTNVVFYEPGKERNTFPYEETILYHVCIKSDFPTTKTDQVLFPLPIGSKPTQADAVLLESQLRSIPMNLQKPSYKHLHRIAKKLLNLTPCQWHVLLKYACRENGLDTEDIVYSVSATEPASQRKQITELVNHLWIEGNHLWADGDNQEYGMPEEENNQCVYDILISCIKAVAPHALY